MRQPLTRQNSTRVKRRYSAYQNRIFVYLVTLVTAPLLLLGVLSSVVYYRQTRAAMPCWPRRGRMSRRRWKLR